jgi:hypothetical protein
MCQVIFVLAKAPENQIAKVFSREVWGRDGVVCLTSSSVTYFESVFRPNCMKNDVELIFSILSESGSRTDFLNIVLSISPRHKHGTSES